MNRCNLCRRTGLVWIRYRDSPGYDLASCTCDQGKWYRTKWTLRAYAAQQDPRPEQVGRLEEFFSPEELTTLRTVEEPYERAARVAV